MKIGAAHPSHSEQFTHSIIVYIVGSTTGFIVSDLNKSGIA